MSLVRASVLAAATVLLALTVGSASSLGSFNDVVASGSAVDVNACRADSVELQDSLGNTLSLLTGGPVEQVEFVGLSGDCQAVVPHVVVIGVPLLSVSEQVVTVEALAPISTSDLSYTSPVPSATDLAFVLENLSLLTDVRVIFTPS